MPGTCITRDMRAAHVKQGLQAILQAMKTDLQSLGQSLLGVAALKLLLAIAWHLSETTLKEHTVKHTLNRNQPSVSPKLSDLLRSGKSNQHSPVGPPTGHTRTKATQRHPLSHISESAEHWPQTSWLSIGSGTTTAYTSRPAQSRETTSDCTSHKTAQRYPLSPLGSAELWPQT